MTAQSDKLSSSTEPSITIAGLGEQTMILVDGFTTQGTVQGHSSAAVPPTRGTEFQTTALSLYDLTSGNPATVDLPDQTSAKQAAATAVTVAKGSTDTVQTESTRLADTVLPSSSADLSTGLASSVSSAREKSIPSDLSTTRSGSELPANTANFQLTTQSRSAAELLPAATIYTLSMTVVTANAAQNNSYSNTATTSGILAIGGFTQSAAIDIVDFSLSVTQPVQDLEPMSTTWTAEHDPETLTSASNTSSLMIQATAMGPTAAPAPLTPSLIDPNDSAPDVKMSTAKLAVEISPGVLEQKLSQESSWIDAVQLSTNPQVVHNGTAEVTAASRSDVSSTSVSQDALMPTGAIPANSTVSPIGNSASLRPATGTVLEQGVSAITISDVEARELIDIETVMTPAVPLALISKPSPEENTSAGVTENETPARGSAVRPTSQAIMLKPSPSFSSLINRQSMSVPPMSSRLPPDNEILETPKSSRSDVVTPAGSSSNDTSDRKIQLQSLPDRNLEPIGGVPEPNASLPGTNDTKIYESTPGLPGTLSILPADETGLRSEKANANQITQAINTRRATGSTASMENIETSTEATVSVKTSDQLDSLTNLTLSADTARGSSIATLAQPPISGRVPATEDGKHKNAPENRKDAEQLSSPESKQQPRSQASVSGGDPATVSQTTNDTAASPVSPSNQKETDQLSYLSSKEKQQAQALPADADPMGQPKYAGNTETSPNSLTNLKEAQKPGNQQPQAQDAVDKAAPTRNSKTADIAAMTAISPSLYFQQPFTGTFSTANTPAVKQESPVKQTFQPLQPSAGTYGQTKISGNPLTMDITEDPSKKAQSAAASPAMSSPRSWSENALLTASDHSVTKPTSPAAPSPSPDSTSEWSIPYASAVPIKLVL